MRRKKQEIKDKSVIEEILLNAEVVRLGFIDENSVYILPFNYGYKDNCIYIHTSKKGKKIDLLEKNNNVGIEIEEKSEINRSARACKWTTKFRSLVGKGKTEIITDFEDKCKYMDIIMKHNGADESTDLEYQKHYINAMSILKINITEIRGKHSENWG